MHLSQIIAALFGLAVTFFFGASLERAAAQEPPSGLRINEFLAVNEDGITDSDGDASDWIELFNAGASSIDASGWHLSDDAEVLDKWEFPAGTVVGAGGFLLVFASGKDRAVAGEELHASFKLSGSESFLALVAADGTTVIHSYAELPGQREDVSYGLGVGGATLPQEYVPDGAACRWLVPGNDLGEGWKQPGFDDSGWEAAHLGLGYGYDEITGENGNLQSAMQGVNGSVFVRVPFEVENPARVVSLTLSMRFEDGYVAWLNGHRIASENDPSPLQWDSVATGSNPDSEAVIPAQLVISPEEFAGRMVAGTNLLAIQGMNTSRGGSDLLVYPNLAGEISAETGATAGYFPEPTPGSLNAEKFGGYVGDLSFDKGRGFYTEAFVLSIATETDGATIRYTTDGSPPAPDNGEVYSQPLSIGETTVVRASAFVSGWVPATSVTHTYIFVADVIKQSGMREAITEDDEYGPLMDDALLSLPTISLATDETRELGSSNSRQLEVPGSAEMIFPDGTEGFQINCGMARVGGFFTSFPKKQFRLYFRKEYGPPTLQFPLFDGFDYEIPPVEEFDAVTIRSGSHDMAQRGAYMSNRFCDDTMLEMGQIAPHGRFIHVYINGEYWGQYHLRERWHAPMFARYFGGKKEDYEAIDANNSGDQFETGTAYDGSGDLWREARNRAREDNTFEATRTHIDMSDYVDWMIMWASGQSESEFRAGGGLSLSDQTPADPQAPLGVPFKFFLKDADGYLRGHSTGRATHNGPISLFSSLRREKDPEYLTLIGDRIHKHFFNGGAMTTEKLVARLQRRWDEIQLSHIAENARWAGGGNFQASPRSWESTVDRYLTNSLPRVNEGMLRAYERAGLYPEVAAPAFSQHGGTIPADGTVQITAENVIYYTTDGTDPRLVGGGINPTASMIDGRGEPRVLVAAESDWKYLDDGTDQGTGWRAPGFDDSGWASGVAELGYGDRDENTEISFGENAALKHVTYYFRKSFEASDVERTIGLTLGLRRDDGAAVYVNGTEVARSNLPAGPLTFETLAGGDTGDEKIFYPFEIDPSVIVNGTNVIAVEVHQERANSSDLSFDAMLDAVLSQGTPTVNLPGSTMLKARVFDGESWSALNEAFFTPAAVEPAKGNLVISELMYNPANPTAAELAAGFDDSDEFEFIEVMNIGSETVYLGRSAFTDGISVRIAEIGAAFLAPGETALLVRNREAFAARYGTVLPVLGSYAGNLRNSGEGVRFENASGVEVQNFAYDDKDPWPTEADGEGGSLELLSPASNPDHAVAANWRASVPGGTPGAGPAGGGGNDYQSWRRAVFSPEELNDPSVSGDGVDVDGDGLTVVFEFAGGGSPKSRDFGLGLEIRSEGGEMLVSYGRSLSASGVELAVESSANLADWEPAGARLAPVETRPINAESERVVLKYTGDQTIPAYLRLRVGAR